MIIGVGLSIVPFIFVHLLNTERIWKSQLCIIEPWLCGDSFTLPQNCLIQNKYDVIVFNAEDGYRFRSISFTHSATGTTYTFNYYLSIEEFIKSTTITMLPGHYIVTGELTFSSYELWEHGFISKDFEWFVYIGIIIISMVIILAGFRECQSFYPEYEITNEEEDNVILKDY